MIALKFLLRFDHELVHHLLLSEALGLVHVRDAVGKSDLLDFCLGAGHNKLRALDVRDAREP